MDNTPAPEVFYRDEERTLAFVPGAGRARYLQQADNGEWVPISEGTTLPIRRGPQPHMGTGPLTPEEAASLFVHPGRIIARGTGKTQAGSTTHHASHDIASRVTLREVTLEVPLAPGILTDTLLQTDMEIILRREDGITIPESSRSVTTVGNEIVIRWEEHA